jgi:AAA domain
MTKIVLPMKIVKAAHKSPKNLIVFSLPKVGKTELAALLKNSLLLDFEDGSDYVDAVKLKINTIDELAQTGKEIKKAGYPYDYVIVDTLSGLEALCLSYAETLYSRTPMGKNWFKQTNDGKLDPASGKATYGDIISMPKGAGYQWTTKAFLKMIEMIKKMAPRMILLGHVKNTQLEKAGAEINSMDLDLTGKLKRTMSSQSDAIGYLYRKGPKQNILSFNIKDDITCGARPDHLRNEEIVISEMVDGKLVAHWDKIYID